LPDGKDPDDLVRSSGPQAVEEALKVAQPMVDVLWTRETEGGDFATPERRAALERRISEALAPITDEVLKKYYRANMAERLKVFFGGARSGPDVPLGKAGAGGWSRNGRGAVAGPSLAGSAVKEGALVRGGRGAISMREALILAAVIGHPHLLERHCESLAGLEFDNLEADRLRGALVDAAALGLVHAGDLADHLTEGGFAPVVERLMASTRPQHWWIGPEAAAPDVEVGFQHVVTLHRKMRTLNKELQLAQAVLERDMTDDNFARLADIKAQIADVQGAEASIEGFGASSGRVTRSM
jgi:DNA primase